VAVFQLTGPDRIVMDVAGEESTTERFTRIRRKFKGGNASSLTLAEQLGMKINKVVIDPGHGGKDPGCIGKSGIMEKNITLDISRRLKTLLEERLNMEVVMTRDRDIFVPLDERTAIANREKADLFISVHVNAAKNRSLRGIETWFLDFGASERSKKVAARENLFSQKRMGDLEKTLNDLLLNNKTQESSRLAEVLQEALTSDLSRRFSNVQSLGVKGAPFMVLVNARMPSVLIEVSFISNPTEEKRLKTDQYRNAVANALLNGVSDYVKSSEYAFSREF
jgi:N-acetylmuramoyl-L-alanine amidase